MRQHLTIKQPKPRMRLPVDAS